MRAHLPRVSDRTKIAQHMAERQTFLATEEGVLSAADMMQVLLGMEAAVVEGPVTRGQTTDHDKEIPRAAFEHAKNQVRAD